MDTLIRRKYITTSFLLHCKKSCEYVNAMEDSDANALHQKDAYHKFISWPPSSDSFQ